MHLLKPQSQCRSAAVAGIAPPAEASTPEDSMKLGSTWVASPAQRPKKGRGGVVVNTGQEMSVYAR